MSHNTHHDALGGAAAGGALGHHQGEGHTVRDAAIGGIGADEFGKHENKQQAQGKVPMSQKLEGKAEELVGKVTHDQTKVAQGAARQAGGATGTTGTAGTGAY